MFNQAIICWTHFGNIIIAICPPVFRTRVNQQRKKWHQYLRDGEEGIYEHHNGDFD